MAVGYLEIGETVERFSKAVCSFREGELDIEAEGSGCSLHIYAVPFKDVFDVAELDGQVCDLPDESIIAEGWTKKRRWFSLVSLVTACRGFDAQKQTIVIVFQAQVQMGFGHWEKLEGSIHCTFVERLR